MPFIRVTDVVQKQVVDLNVAHIVGFTPATGREQTGSLVTLANGDVYHVEDTPRSLRGYIKKAEGTLPEPKDEVQVVTSNLPEWEYAKP